MKYPDINIQIKYPNKLINADTPKVRLIDQESRQKRKGNLDKQGPEFQSQAHNEGEKKAGLYHPGQREKTSVQ